MARLLAVAAVLAAVGDAAAADVVVLLHADEALVGDLPLDVCRRCLMMLDAVAGLDPWYPVPWGPAVVLYGLNLYCH